MEYDGLITKPTLEELYHHGIKGQKWGVKNGPPYPLSSKISTGKALKKSPSSKKGQTANKNKSQKYGMIDPLIAYALLTVGGYAVTGLVLGGAALADKIAYKNGKKKISKLREKEAIDPKTGLHLKNEQMTEKEDLKATNPERKNLKNQEGAGNNCTFCTTAYDLRRRGFDVHAGTTIKGYTNAEIASWYKKGKFTKIEQTPETLTSRSAAQDFIKQSIINSSGEGSRGNITVRWDGTFSGHSMIYEVHDGKLILMDGQINAVYKNPDIILSRVNPSSVNFMRTDNLTPDYEKLKKMGIIK